MLLKRKKIAITPIGGVDGVGHNCFLYVGDDAAIVVDCGIKPRHHEKNKQNATLENEFSMPDFNWTNPPPRLDILDEILRKKKNAIGIITHAHLDHIGAVAELGKRKLPIYLSQWSKKFMERYAENLQIPAYTKCRTFNENENLQHGNFKISFVPLQHSIPGNYGVLMRLGAKNVLHLGDFKFNGTKESIKETERTFQEIRNRVGKIHCLVLDVLNVEMDGFTPPEQRVFDSLEKIIKETRGRVIISFFSSNLKRMEEILRIGKAQHKVVGISGWGMSDSYNLLGKYFPPKNGNVILVCGSQGEDNSGLAKMSRNEHRYLRLSSKDTIVFSSRCIPGNEKGIKTLLQNLRNQRARIILHEKEKQKLNLPFDVEERFLHVSGHGQRSDIMKAIEILKPEVIIPFHAPQERYDILEDIVGKKQKIRRLQEGETIQV